MIKSKWKRIDFQQFINDFGVEVIVEHTPTILYSKKDKEHEAFKSLIAFFLVASVLLIYISVSLFLIEIYFSIFVFIIVISLTTAGDVLLIFNYIKSNVSIKPIECWVEIYSYLNFYCFSYYIVYSGKCHPNKAKNIIFKLYQDEVLKNTIDITQIEFYIKINQKNINDVNYFGYFFEYAEGRPFWNENINHNIWKFFPYEVSKNNNYIAIANWAHQYEWRNDLELDFDKLHEYAPWVIKRWNTDNLKPLKENFKKTINWNSRYIESTPKLEPWEGDLENKSYEFPHTNWEDALINDAIKKVIGEEYRVKNLKDLKLDLFELKAYFRDLNV
ncbi:MAG: hypothetical protein ACFFDO_09100 [Candidatus Thorarchaeota archaeon]